MSEKVEPDFLREKKAVLWRLKSLGKRRFRMSEELIDDLVEERLAFQCVLNWLISFSNANSTLEARAACCTRPLAFPRSSRFFWPRDKRYVSTQYTTSMSIYETITALIKPSWECTLSHSWFFVSVNISSKYMTRISTRVYCKRKGVDPLHFCAEHIRAAQWASILWTLIAST